MEAKPAGTIDRALLSGVLSTAAAKWVSQLLSWVSTVAVAHVLAPKDFGILGMALVVLGFFTLINTVGLGAAVVQNRAMTAEMESRLATASVYFGLLLSGVGFAASWPVAWFFDEPAVRAVMAVMSTSLILGGLQVVPRGILQRNLKFGVLAKIDAAESITTAVTTVTLALLGNGYWSLVLGNLSGKLMAAALVLRAGGRRFAPLGRLRELRDELHFGLHVMLANIAWYVYGSADVATIGRRLDSGAVGAYGFALDIATTPLNQVTGLIARVVPGVFSAVQHDRAALLRYLAVLVETQAFVLMPAAAGLALAAPDLIPVLLGAEWLPAVTPLRFLAISGALRSLSPVLVQGLIYSGFPRSNTRITIGGALALPPLFWLGAEWGTAGVAAGWLLGELFVLLPLKLTESGRHLGFGFRMFLRSCAPAFACTVLMALAVFGVRSLPWSPGAAPLRLAATVATGAAAYALVVRVLYWGRILTFIRTLRSLRSLA